MTLVPTHIEELSRGESVCRNIAEGELPYYDAENKIAHIYWVIETELQYQYSLHELGHLHLGHGVPTDWDDEVRQEIAAWNWVAQKTILRIPPDLWQQWQEERIKGSWE